MKVVICLVVLGCVAGALCDNKPNFHYQPQEPKPFKDWSAQPAGPNGGVNIGVEKRPTIYDNGNLKVQGVGGADRNFGGPGDGSWNAKVGGRAEWAWGRRN